MKIIVLAAGQGTRLRPLTNDRPKCMVEINEKSIIDRQIDTMCSCGIREEDIIIVTGYRSDLLQNKFMSTNIRVVINDKFEKTNMVYSLMCAKNIMVSEDDIIISYGDIVYETSVFERILLAKDDMSVVVDDEWYNYWSERCENPLEDAETLMFDADDFLTEIGQKTTELDKVQSQYIGLMRFKNAGLDAVLNLAAEAERRSENGETLWHTDRNYSKMYMTDLLQALIDEGEKLRAVHIQRGWFEIDNYVDLKVVESKIR